jgi:hypothetical protein
MPRFTLRVKASKKSEELLEQLYENTRELSRRERDMWDRFIFLMRQRMGLAPSDYDCVTIVLTESISKTV